jgi:hypothetical protein
VERQVEQRRRAIPDDHDGVANRDDSPKKHCQPHGPAVAQKSKSQPHAAEREGSSGRRPTPNLSRNAG